MLHLLSRTALPVLAVLALGAGAGAQTTHTVDVNSLTFSPAGLAITTGDTVEWVWVTGFHNVVSGSGGVADGIFSSGAVVGPPNTFSVTFDQAFLSANPVPGNVYDYFCSVHFGFGMVGSVTVTDPPCVPVPSWAVGALGTMLALAGLWLLRRTAA